MSWENTPCGLSQPGTTQAWTIHTVFFMKTVHVGALLGGDALVGGERNGDLAGIELHADVGVPVPVVVGSDEPGRRPAVSDSYITPTIGALSAVLA